ncbi:MAG: sulfatase-like hydrolase/transferase, partial [Planctomycetaceae bacterium]|nr:sulfatase-like hydrolase/transferase [Planctomycetaceae bacterium]
EVLKPAGYGCYYVGKWHMHPETGPIKRGFDEFYGYTDDHSHDQYDADYYIRLPEGRAKEIDPPADQFYATDVFSEYALEFMRQGQQSGKPWLLFLGHSSPHFPIQAPAERADRFEEIYQRGWDVLREERFAKMKQLGLINGDHWTFTERSLVPVDRDDIANGFSGQENPAWDSLPKDRQHDLARRMAVFAAMVEGVDRSVGMITEHLHKTGDFDNTLILFLSDNGACYEWGPFGFDGVSRRGETILRTGDDVRSIGGRGTHQSYGSAWANLGNTPLRLYKHFTHEGGISTPFIAHWPSSLPPQEKWVRNPAHVMDIMPTILDATGASYPESFDGRPVTPAEGTSLLPMLRGEVTPERTLGFDHQAAHALRKGDWKLVWSKRMPHEIQWELYNLAEDRCETHDLAKEHPQRVASMAAEWDAWARRVGVIHEPAAAVTETPTPQIANQELRIEAEVQGRNLHGVVLAQGGSQLGYALHFDRGVPMFDVRIHKDVRRIAWPQAVANNTDRESIRLVARLTADTLTLSVNGADAVVTESPGLIPEQPQDGLSVGFDDRSAAGDYQAPHPFTGQILLHRVTAGAP